VIVLFVLLFLLIALAVMLRKARTAGRGYVTSAGIFTLRSAPPERNHRPAVARRDFRALSIQTTGDCCQPVRALDGKRCFPGQIPNLPLPQCDAPACNCRYEHHADRRRDEMRRSVSVSLPEDERRRLPERRRYH
jgi:hypothetical protein